MFTFRMKLNCNGDLILLFGIKSVFSLCLYTCACYMSVDRYERCFNYLCMMSENRNQRLSFAFASLLIARLFFFGQHYFIVYDVVDLYRTKPLRKKKLIEAHSCSVLSFSLSMCISAFDFCLRHIYRRVFVQCV